MAAVVVLAMLLPGFVWLTLTSRRRVGAVNQTTLEEFLLVVVAGFAMAAPPALLAAVFFSDETLHAIDTLSGSAPLTKRGVRETALLLGGVAISAVVLALAAAGIFSLVRPVVSGQSVWFDVLGRVPVGAGIYLEVELLDGRVVRGQLEYFDGTPIGRGRDIALRADSMVSSVGLEKEFHGRGVVVLNEHDIRSITAQTVTANGQPHENNGIAAPKDGI